MSRDEPGRTPPPGHPNDPEAVRAHLWRERLKLTEEERRLLLDQIARKIAEIDARNRSR